MRTRWRLGVALLAGLVALAAASLPAHASTASGCDQKKDCPCGMSEEQAAKHGFTNCKATEGDPIDPTEGAALVTLPGPYLGMWSLGLNYASDKEQWFTTDSMYLNKMAGGNTMHFYPDAHVTMVFKRDNGTSPWVAYGDADDPIKTFYTLEGDNTEADMTLYYDTNRSKTTYTFYGFPADPDNTAYDGYLKSVSIGDPSTSLQKVSYTYDEVTGQVSTATDEHLRTITYQYSGTYLKKTIEPHPGAASPLSNLHGRVTWFEYNGGKLVRVETGMPKTAGADAGTDGSTAPTSADYHWRRTALVYGTNGKLSHVIPPEQYDAWVASTEPDKDDKYATQKYEYYATGHEDAGCAKKVTAAGCGCAGVLLGVEYEYPVPDNNVLYLTEPDNANKPAFQASHYRYEGGERVLTAISQTNSNHSTVFRLARATDTTGWLTQNHYDNDNRYVLDNVTEYAVTFDWANPGNATYTANDMLAARQYVHDAEYRLTEQQTWNGSSYVTVKEWAYDGDSDQLDNTTRHVDGSTTLVTHTIYDNDMRVVCTVHPKVLSTQNSYDGDNYDVDYYLGERTFHDDYGRVTEERGVRLSDTPSDWDNVETDEATLASTKFYYADDDNLDNDDDESVDEADGSEGFLLTRRIVDEDGLHLEVRYEYSVVSGAWRKTAQIVDPDNCDGQERTYLDLVTTYDYETVNPERGAWGNPTTITEPESAYVTTLDYDKAGRVLSRTRTCGGETVSASRYSYCKYGKACSTTEAAGLPEERSTVTEWDEAGRTKTLYENVQDLEWQNGSWSGTVRGNVTEYGYITGTGRVSSVKRKAGWASCPATTIASYAYTVDGKQETVTDALGNETDYAYDTFRNLDNVTNALDEVAKFTYDRQGRQTFTEQEDDASNLMAKTASQYDAMGRIYQAIVYNVDNEDHTIATNVYHDPLGQVVKEKDPGNNETVYTYDKAGRNTVVQNAVSCDVYNSYDPAGRLVVVDRYQIVQGGRHVLSIHYFDSNGRPAATALWGTNTPPDGWSWDTEPVPWDSDNIPSSAGASDDNHLVTAYAYGCDTTYGPYTCVTDPKGIQGFSYEDRLGRATRTVESVDGLDRITLVAYDDAVEGKAYYQDVITARNESAADQVTKYVRADSADVNRVTTTVYPDGGEVVLAYNADGTVKTRTDQRDWQTAYTYDALRRPTQEDVEAIGDVDLVGTSKVTCEYDALGRVTQITDNNGEDDDNHTLVTHAYDWSDTSTNRTVTETQYLDDVQTGQVTSIINSEAERTTLTYPNARALTLGYDALHRLTTITDGGTALASYTYTGMYLTILSLRGGNLQKTLDMPGTGYDDFDRIGNVYYAQSGVGIVQRWAYTYDDASNPLSQDDQVNANVDEAYTYDALHRLATYERGTLSGGSIASPVFEQGWTLDKLGNWTELDDNDTDDVRQHNEVNEIALPAGGQGQVRTIDGTPREITHDAAGNIATYETEDGSQTYEYSYDYRNRLIQVDNVASGSPIVQYVYDGINRRVKKDVETGTDVIYVYDGWQVVEERELDGASWEARRQYVYGGQYVDEVLIFDRDDDNDGQCDNMRYLYCHNANWNVMALADNEGVPVERYDYEPYGSFTVALDNESGNPYHFQGRRYGEETGLYYFRNRDYHPKLGRFLQRDPVVAAGSGSLYEFAGSMPTRAVDPAGRKWIVVDTAGAEIPKTRVESEPETGLYTWSAEYWKGSYQIKLWPNEGNKVKATAMVKSTYRWRNVFPTFTGHRGYFKARVGADYQWVCNSNTGEWRRTGETENPSKHEEHLVYADINVSETISASSDQKKQFLYVLVQTKLGYRLAIEMTGGVSITPSVGVGTGGPVSVGIGDISVTVPTPTTDIGVSTTWSSGWTIKYESKACYKPKKGHSYTCCNLDP